MREVRFAEVLLAEPLNMSSGLGMIDDRWVLIPHLDICLAVKSFRHRFADALDPGFHLLS